MTVTFGALCSLLQSIEIVTTRQPRLPADQEKSRIRETVSNWFLNQREALDDPDTNGGAVLSALFPHRRKDRVYGLQPSLLAKKLAKLLAFSHDQLALFDGWKAGVHGDLGAYVERAMRPWDGTFTSKRTFPIEQIDELLLQLAARCRFSDEAIRRKRDWDVKVDMKLKDILVRLESWEAKWLVRLILRDHCTVRLEEGFILERYHFLLPELLMFQNDFDAVFTMLRGELSCYPAVPEPSKQKSMRIAAARKLRAIVGIKVGRPTFHKAWSLKHCFQLVGQRAWAAEVKYDGEYCEIHIDLDHAPNHIQIYSKNGKDATADRMPLHGTIHEALRIGRPDCKLEKKCIVLGEMVLYSDRERRILPFSKIRKHISRSGSCIGTLQDSLPHEWEHLMIVFFDVLVLDDEMTLRHGLQDRRKILRDLVRVVPGRSMRSEWTLLNFCQDKTGDGITDLKQTFARNLAERQEGLVLKPLHAPYFPLLSEQGHREAGFFIKLKQDYLADMGVECRGEKPKFMVVASLSLDKCIPKSDVKYMNTQGYVRQSVLQDNHSTAEFDIQYPKGFERPMTAVFKDPFVAEILGGGYEKLQNESFEMLRHPRVKKIHHDRTWVDAVSLDDLERMAEEKYEVPNADKLDGHARDVALLVKKYVKETGGSQSTTTTDDTTQQTTQQTTPRSSPVAPRPTITRTISQLTPNGAVVQETPEQSCTTVSTSYGSIDDSTQGKGTRASRELRILVREDTPERLNAWAPPATMSTAPESFSPSLLKSSAISASLNIGKRRSFVGGISPPNPKRRKALAPLHPPGSKCRLSGFDNNSQEGIIHLCTRKGAKVQAHTGSRGKMHKS